MKKKLFEKIISWGDKKFPQETLLQMIDKLDEEFDEVCDDIFIHKSSKTKEFADFFIVAMRLAAKCGFSYDELNSIIEEKFLIIESQEFELKKGVYKRIKA